MFFKKRNCGSRIF